MNSWSQMIEISVQSWLGSSTRTCLINLISVFFQYNLNLVQIFHLRPARWLIKLPESLESLSDCSLRFSPQSSLVVMLVCPGEEHILNGGIYIYFKFVYLWYYDTIANGGHTLRKKYFFLLIKITIIRSLTLINQSDQPLNKQYYKHSNIEFQQRQMV